LFIDNKKIKPVKMTTTLFLVSLTLSFFLTFVYALPGKIGGGGDGGSKAGSFGLQNSPSGFERPDNNNRISENKLGAFSGIERSPSPPSNNGPTGGLGNLGTSSNNGPPAALSGLQQRQQQQQPLPNANHVDGCPTVVHPNGADTKVVQPSNCSPPVNTPQTNSRVIRTNNDDNCAAVVHPNGADTKVVNNDNCPLNTNAHVTVDSGGTTTSSSSSLTINNVQGSNSGTSSRGSSSSTTANTIPIANAGPNQKVHPSDRVVLDGSKSSDSSGGGSLKFSWLQIAGGPAISLANHDKTKAIFVAPLVTANTILTFQLIVNNGNYYSAPSYVTVTVQP
jgi:K319L-like, PKD domain